MLDRLVLSLRFDRVAFAVHAFAKASIAHASLLIVQKAISLVLFGVNTRPHVFESRVTHLTVPGALAPTEARLAASHDDKAFDAGSWAFRSGSGGSSHRWTMKLGAVKSALKCRYSVVQTVGVGA